MNTQNLAVNFERLKANIEMLATIGKSDDQGIYRMAFSDGDMAGRDWLIEQIKQAGLDFYQDGAANIHARYDWNDVTPGVMTGSHIDTVPGAGHLDGALGVLCGLEALMVLKENKCKLLRPLELVAFSDEEGRFGGMFGSQSMSGEITPEWIHSASDLSGKTLIDAMSAQGLNAMDALSAARPAESLYAFVELHIEQGPVLDREGISIGIVEGICGLKRWEVRLVGIANHAGTTPMAMRADAFQGMVDFATEIDQLLEAHGGSDSVATIGRVELVPGAANVVPGEAKFSLEFRDIDTTTLAALEDAFRSSLSAIGRKRNLMFEFEVMSDISPVACDARVQKLIRETCSQLKQTSLSMPSGAAHDTQKIARKTAAGMIFVPSREGRSHSAAEWTAWSDIESGANVLLNTLYQLSNEDLTDV